MKEKTAREHAELVAKGPTCLADGEWSHYLDSSLNSHVKNAQKLSIPRAIDHAELLQRAIASVVRRANKGRLNISFDLPDGQCVADWHSLGKCINQALKDRMSDMLEPRKGLRQHSFDSLQVEPDCPKHSARSSPGDHFEAINGPSQLAWMLTEGFNHAEIAEQLGMNATQLKRQIATLGSWLAGQYPDSKLVIRYRQQQLAQSGGVA